MAASSSDSPGGAHSRYNANSASVRRLMKEGKEMAADASTLYSAAPLDDNLFEWHFTIRGPKDTDFEGGVYHGRILFPSDYPYRPPDIVFLTKNGRFELEKKICLTISSHHEETWRPSWSIRTVLVALIAFMPTKGDGAIASLDWTPEERKRLAQQSLTFKCDRCGVHNSTALRPEDANETLNPSDIPEELQIRDSSKKPSASASPSPSSVPEASGSSSAADLDSLRPDESYSPHIDRTHTPTTTLATDAVDAEQIPLAADATGPQQQNAANADVDPHAMRVAAESQIIHTMREYMDILLSVVVLLIGLLVIRKLFVYL